MAYDQSSYLNVDLELVRVGRRSQSKVRVCMQFASKSGARLQEAPSGASMRPGSGHPGEGCCMSLGNKVAAEFVGTFWLVFGGCGSAVLAAGFSESLSPLG
jgi:hypothetical protein